MLVLSRRKGEAVVIDDNITVTVIEIREDKVRLGIELPREIPLYRKEVHDAIRDVQVTEIQSLESQPAMESQPEIIRRLEQVIKDQKETIRLRDARIEQLIRGE